MFYVNRLNAKGEVHVDVVYSGETITFDVSSVISNKNKHALDNNNTFNVLNGYLKYKGDVFKSELWTVLNTSLEDTKKTVYSTNMYPLPFHIAHPVLDMFDVLDIFNYIKYIYKLTPPSNLSNEFDPIKESDNQGSRVQTYLKDDYIELAALTMILKVGLLPIGEFGRIKLKEIRDSHLEYVLFEFFKTHRIFNSPPMEKFYGYIKKLIDSPINSKENKDIAVLENQIPKSEMPMYILAAIVFQRLVLTPFLESDGDDNNIVTKTYVAVNMKLKDSRDTSKTIRDRKGSSSGSGDDADKESFIEGSRTLTDITTLDKVLICRALSSIERITRQLPKPIKDVLDLQALQDATEFTMIFNNGNFHKSQIAILGVLFKSIMDPRALAHTTKDCIINLMIVGFAYLWGINSKHLALLLVSQALPNTGDIHQINGSTGRSRLSKEHKDMLDIIAPYKRAINDTTSVNILEEWINRQVISITNTRWLQTAPDEYVESALNSKNYAFLLTPDIRIQLADMLIKNEELSYESIL